MGSKSVTTVNENSTLATGEQVTFSDGRDGPPNIRILHYNDVYHIEAGSAEPAGGIARFQTLCNYYRDHACFEDQPKLLTFFSGDAYNPSLESSVTKGSHMVPFLNNVGTNAACVGNHDLDFGVTQFRHLAKQCHFPWLLANVLDPALGEDIPLGNVQKTALLETSSGIKIGVIGLVEREWLATINSLPPDLIYKSASETAKELVPGLRQQGAEIIVAITHQREPNDNKLAEKTPEGLIDIILGGHDHFYGHSIINGTHILRSGTDFKQLSYMEIRRRQGDPSKWGFHIIRRDVVRSTPEEPRTVELVEKLTSKLKAKLEKPIGITARPLDARFTTVRMKESNMGNFVADLMRLTYQADCCIMAAGTIRGDQIYPPGVLKMKDVMNCFPFEDPVVVVKVNGKAILDALENAVSKYPALEGRFPQVSNISFEFDPKRPEGSRVTHANIGGRLLDESKSYALATRGYMARGKDGYSSLLIKSEGGEAEEIVSEENGMLISMILRQYFMSLKVLGKWRRWGNNMGRHWENVHYNLHHQHPTAEPEEVGGEVRSPPAKKAKMSPSKAGNSPSKKLRTKQSKSPDPDLSSSEEDEEDGATTNVMQNSSQPLDHYQTSALPFPDLSAREKDLLIMRKVMRKWERLAGVKDTRVMDTEGEFIVGWTKGIRPKVEGRIRIVGQA